LFAGRSAAIAVPSARTVFTNPPLVSIAHGDDAGPRYCCRIRGQLSTLSWRSVVIEIAHPWYYRPDYVAIMSTCDTKIGVWSEK
jgi:hypothetical protein